MASILVLDTDLATMCFHFDCVKRLLSRLHAHEGHGVDPGVSIFYCAWVRNTSAATWAAGGADSTDTPLWRPFLAVTSLWRRRSSGSSTTLVPFNFIARPPRDTLLLDAMCLVVDFVEAT